MKKVEFTINIEMEHSLVSFYTMLVQTGMKYTSEMTIAVGEGHPVDLKSILGLMSVAIINGKQAVITVNGEDEVKAAIELTALVDSYKN